MLLLFGLLLPPFFGCSVKGVNWWWVLFAKMMLITQPAEFEVVFMAFAFVSLQSAVVYFRWFRGFQEEQRGEVASKWWFHFPADVCARRAEQMRLQDEIMRFDCWIRQLSHPCEEGPLWIVYPNTLTWLENVNDEDFGLNAGILFQGFYLWCVMDHQNNGNLRFSFNVHQMLNLEASD